MSRLVEPRAQGASLRLKRNAEGDSYLERVAKYVPAEIVAAYIVIVGFAANVPESSQLVAFIVAFAVCLIATPFYLGRMVEHGRPKVVHLIVSSIAFCVWAFAVGGGAGLFGTAGLNIHDPNWASIALVIFTLASGLIEPREAS